jgi:hypothetical protein
MKKLLPYILIFLLLGGGVAYFVYAYSPSTLEKKESQFAVRKIESITKLVLTDIKGGKLTLTRGKNQKWIVNGQYDINEEAEGLLFTAVQKMETQYPVPTNAQPLVLKDMAKERVKCEIYTGDDKPSLVYYVGGATADGTGTYVIAEIDGQMAHRPYVVHIPGIDAYLTSRFRTDDQYWRTRWIFRDNDMTIQSVSVYYNQEKQKSFTITKAAAKDSFVIANSDGATGDQPKQRFIRQYLQFFDGLSLEAYENKNPIKDSILSGEPFCTMSMTRNDGSKTKAEIFYMPINDQSRVQFDDNGRKLIYDVEHYYLGMNDRKDMGLIQYYVWGKVLRNYSEFYAKPGTAPTPQAH